MYYNQVPSGKDPQLWEIAKRRASFRTHLAVYLIMSVFFWVLWYFTGSARYSGELPWPVWPMFGWGIGVVSHYISAFTSPKNNAAEKEYIKLVEKQSKQ